MYVIGEPGDNVKGSIDVKFVGTDVTAENVEQRLEDGYIVHPAFCDESGKGYENGGWNSELSGIWVAKYEMSMEENNVHKDTNDTNTGNVITNETIKAVSKPNVSSWRYISIGNSYTNGMEYDRSKDSHMMKNSEWGAVAYLTHSEYGRNGEEISVNQSSKYITGAGDEASSTTKNKSGIYDLSGGAWERVAAFNDKDTHDYETTYGGAFAGINQTSSKWATKYSLDNNIPTEAKSKVGDAIWDVYVKSNKGWFNDCTNLMIPDAPFVGRGGAYGDGAMAGVFAINGSKR